MKEIQEWALLTLASLPVGQMVVGGSLMAWAAMRGHRSNL